jgi:hypothetical protein
MNQAERSWVADARARLAQRCGEKPATKAGQVRALWPEIEAALQGGQSMKSIRKWLEEDAGIRLGLTSLTSYISRIRRRESAVAASARQGDERVSICARTAGPAKEPMRDPLAPAIQVLSKRRFDIRELHGDGDPQDQNLV